VYAAILQGDPQNAAALAGLARCYLKSGDTARAEQTLELVPPDMRDSGPVASARAALELAKVAGTAGDTAKLKAKVEAEPANHQARIDYAVALAAGGKKSEAAEQLLESFRRDRKWNDEAARKQLLKLFDAWGPKDPATLEGRRKLSSILFS
jgi:putative thioredoxin